MAPDRQEDLLEVGVELLPDEGVAARLREDHLRCNELGDLLAVSKFLWYTKLSNSANIIARRKIDVGTIICYRYAPEE